MAHPDTDSPRPGRAQTVAAAVLVVALVLIVGLLAGRWWGDASAPTAQAGPSASPSASASPTPTVPEVYQRVLPSVVVITTDRRRLGSGVVARGDGRILTAAHVVEGARRIALRFADGSRTTATVVARDEKSDVAALAPASLPQTLVPATFGGRVDVGGAVVAIGNPLGLAASVSTGVVSGLDRDADTADGEFTGLIQFDAAVNPGSSGGPLLDADGHVIGIVVSIADPGRDEAFAGIGFAVPIGTALGGPDDAPQV